MCLRKLIPFLAALSITLVGLINHELWFDEIQAWGRIIEAKSLFDLLAHLPYEGHPPLYYLLLYPLKWISTSVNLLKIFHALQIVLCLWLIHYKSKLNLEAKILILGNYYLLFEYGIFTRPYLLGFCLLFLLVYAHTQGLKRLKVLVLCLLPMLHAFLFVISACYLLLLFIKKEKLKTFILPSIIHLLIFFYMLPPNDLKIYGITHSSFGLKRFIWIFNNIARSFFPMFEFKLDFWNTHILDNSTLILTLLSFMTLFIIYFTLKKKKILFLWFGLSLGSLFLFSYLKIQGSYRHYGIAFIFFLAIICSIYDELNERQKNTFSFILIVQSFFGLYAFSMDVMYPFSSAKESAAFLKTSNLINNDTLLIGDTAMATPPLSHFLNQRVLQLRTMEKSYFLDYQKKMEDCLEVVHDFKRNIFQMRCLKNLELIKSNKNIIFITNYELPSAYKKKYRFKLIYKSAQAIYKQEIYWVYKQGPIGHN